MELGSLCGPARQRLKRLVSWLQRMGRVSRREAIDALPVASRDALLQFMTSWKASGAVRASSDFSKARTRVVHPKTPVQARSPMRSRGGVRRVRQGAFQATICFCRLMVRSATTHCHLRANAFHAVLTRLYELAMGARGSSAELDEDHIAWATEVALAETGLCESDLRPSYAAVVSSGCLAGVIESPTTSSLTQALAWRWRLGLAREHGWTELQKVWVEVLREARPGGSRPLSTEKAVLRVQSAWQRQASRRQAIRIKSEVRLSRRNQRLAASNLRRCAAADARLKELVAQAGKRWEGILRRAAGGKGNAKRRRSDSCQPRQA